MLVFSSEFKYKRKVIIKDLILNIFVGIHKFEKRKNSFQLTKEQENSLQEINYSNQKFNVHLLQVRLEE